MEPHRRFDAIRPLTLGLLVAGLSLGAWLITTVDAEAQGNPSDPVTPRVLRVVHHWRDVTWQNQDAACVKRTPYEWRADRHTTSLADRWRIARWWYERSQRAYSPSCQPAYSSGVPAWFTADLVCIGQLEEGGSNSIAGYYGYVYAPSQYQDPGPSIAATYGDSWLGVPRSAQNALAWSLYSSYGWSPWSTAASCGLA